MHRKRRRSSSGTSRVRGQRQHAAIECEQRQLAIEQRGGGVSSDRLAGAGSTAPADPAVRRCPSAVTGSMTRQADRRRRLHRPLVSRPRRPAQPQAAALGLPVERREVRLVRRELLGRGLDAPQRGPLPAPPAPRRPRPPRRAGASAAACRWSASPGRASSPGRPRPAAAASSSAPCSVRCALSTPKRSHSASRLLRLPGKVSRASASVSIDAGVQRRAAAAGPARPNSASRNATSNGALWMTHCAPRANSTNSAAMSANLGLPFRSSHVMPCTSVAPASISRSGST